MMMLLRYNIAIPPEISPWLHLHKYTGGFDGAQLLYKTPFIWWLQAKDELITTCIRFRRLAPSRILPRVSSALLERRFKTETFTIRCPLLSPRAWHRGSTWNKSAACATEYSLVLLWPKRFCFIVLFSLGILEKSPPCPTGENERENAHDQSVLWFGIASRLVWRPHLYIPHHRNPAGRTSDP